MYLPRTLRLHPRNFAIPPLFVAAFFVTITGCAAPQRADRPLPEPLLATRPGPSLPAPPRRPLTPPQAPPQTAQPLRGATILVDAGHGGHDPGALGVGPAPEKVVNLGLSQRLVKRLEALGATVSVTRNDDTFLSLDQRALLADRRRVDAFISIHADAARRASASGATVYIARQARRESEGIARSVHAALERAGIKSRGIRRADFRVLVGHSRPAILLESGFLTNRREARLLSQAEYQQKVADAVANGLATYFSRGR
jgi:N-acetylmuramoyl-L-alanine amidase